MLRVLACIPWRESPSTDETEFQLQGCYNRLQHRCNPAITNGVKYFTPKAKTVNLASSPVSWKVEKKLLYTHAASQVFIRSHNRHFLPAVNEKAFHIVIMQGGVLGLCHPAGILPSSGHRLNKMGRLPGRTFTGSFQHRTLSYVSRVEGSSREGAIQVYSLWGATCLTSYEVRLPRCNTN